jgi:elongation factor Ts
MSLTETIKKLRYKTSAGMMECKKALEESGGDMEKAIEFLRKKGVAKAAKKADRVAGQGVIESYIHMGNRIGVLVEVNCETDFVARNDNFKAFTKEIAMQIAAASPLYVSRDDVPAEVVEKEKDIFRTQVKDKPAEVVEKIIEGKLNKYYSEVCLLEQPYIKDTDKTVQELLTENISTIGENIVIKRFVRYEVGEEL